jgi:hypothetical protein
VPARRPELGLTGTPSVFKAVRDDVAAYAGNYDLMRFHVPGDLAGRGVWIQPERGTADIRQYCLSYNPDEILEHFAPVQSGDRLLWPQTDWAEGVPCYTGYVQAGAPPVRTVAQVGLAWRVTSAEQLRAYYRGYGQLI